MALVPPSSPAEFGLWLSGILGDRGIKQSKLAADLNLSENAVSAWTTGQAMPRRRNLEALLERLQVRPAQPAATTLAYFVTQVAELQPSLEGLAAAAPDLLRVLQEAQQRLAEQSTEPT